MPPLLVEYLRQFGRFQRNARLYLLSNALSGVTTGIILVLYNLYLTSLGYGTDFIGLALFVITIGAGVAIFPAGICIDRLGGKFVLIWSSLLIGLAGIGQILFRQPLPLLVSGFIAGVAGAFTLVVNAPFLTRNSTPAERPHLFSLNIVLGLVTAVIGSVLGGALPVWFRSIAWLMGPLPSWSEMVLAGSPEPRSYQLAMLFAGAIALPSFIPLLMMSNDRARRVIQQAVPYPGPVQASQASRVGTRVKLIPYPNFRCIVRAPRASRVGTSPASSSPGCAAPTTTDGRVKKFYRNLVGVGLVPTLRSLVPTLRSLVPTLRSLVPTLRRPVPTLWTTVRLSSLPRILHTPLFLLVLVQVFIGAGAGLFIPYFNIYFVQHLQASPALFGVLNGGATAINALLTLVAPWLAMRLGKVNAIALTQLVSIPLLITIGLAPLLPLTATLYLFRQGFMDMSNGVLQVFSMEAVPERYRGLANSSYQVAFQVPWALSAPLGGILIAHVGYPAVFLGGAVCYLLACGTLWGNFGRGREKQFGQERALANEKALRS